MRHWLNCCHCLKEDIKLIFINEKIRFISSASPEQDYSEVREHYEEDGEWLFLMAGFLSSSFFFFFFFFLKQNTFLLIACDLTALVVQILKRTLANHYDGFRSICFWYPVAFRSSNCSFGVLGCANTVQQEILMCEGPGSAWGTDKTSSITNIWLTDRGQSLGATGLHRLQTVLLVTQINQAIKGGRNNKHASGRRSCRLRWAASWI